MRLGRLVPILLRNDARLILRDRMLVMLLVMVVVIGVACRYALPAIDATLAANGVMPAEPGGMRFSQTFPVFVAFVALWQGALMPATVFGFLLLDEKEDDTLTVMRVCPVPLASYITYRVLLPAALALAFALALPPLIGLCTVAWWQHLVLALGASVTAPIAALLLATYADNKVQGLAYTKFSGVAGLTILIGGFTPEPWQWLLGVFPPFLVAKAYWLALEGRAIWGPVLAAGVLVQLGLLRWLVRRFRAVAFRRPP